MRGNPHVRFGPEAAGKGPAPCRHLAGVLPVCSMRISARSSSSSAPTSPTPPSCASTATMGRAPAAKAGIGFEALDNGSPRSMTWPSADDLRLRRPEQIDALLRKWLAHPAQPVHRRRRRRRLPLRLSILQAEFSLTQMLDEPASGRIFFEQVIRDNLDIGGPDQIALSSTATP